MFGLNIYTKGPSLCQVKSVVYSVVCSVCDERHKVDTSQKHLGRYIGQTSRTLAERAAEHLAGLTLSGPGGGRILPLFLKMQITQEPLH